MILWQDEQLVVCIKPAGVASQGDGSGDSMETLLSDRLGGRFFPVHRLDRGVGGVMVYARSAKAAAALSISLQNHEFHKEYLAVCEGTPAPAEWTDLLYHDKRAGKAYPVKKLRNGVKEAKLSFVPEKTVTFRGKTFSICRVKLMTGRFHQIRVQFASRGYPLAGDGKYGSKVNCPIGLFSCRLTFVHPDGREMTFRALPPETAPWNWIVE